MATQNVYGNEIDRLKGEIEGLKSQIGNIDCMSYEGLSEISAIARLAVHSLETPDGYQHVENVARALIAIRNKADETLNIINAEAETAGCNHVDEALHRRMDARHTYRESFGKKSDARHG